MSGITNLNQSLFAEISKKEFTGSGVLKLSEGNFNIDFTLTLTESRAFVSFPCPDFFLEVSNGFTLSGQLMDGRSVQSSSQGNISSSNLGCHAECFNLIIGNTSDISTIKTTLLGIYLPHTFSFEYENQTITVYKSDADHQLAGRTHQISGAILEGNKVKVEGTNLKINETNDLFRYICFLLRIISSSQVYFSQLIIDNGQAIIYHQNSIRGKLFGLKKNVLNSTFDLSNYLKKGLTNYLSLSDDDRQTIINTGYDLSTSAASGLMETSLMALITSLERLGSLAKNKGGNKKQNDSKREHLKKLKAHLKDEAQKLLNTSNEFNEDEKNNLYLSISRIQYWDLSFIRSIKEHLKENGWNVEIDFRILKEVRDSLAHTGMLPNHLSNKDRYKLLQQLEYFLLVHALDLLGVRLLVSAEKEGWAVYLKPEDIKKISKLY